MALQVYLCGASGRLCGALRHLCGAQNILCGAQIYTLWRSKIYLNFQKISFKKFFQKNIVYCRSKRTIFLICFLKKICPEMLFEKRENPSLSFFFETTTGFSRNPFKNISFIFLWHLIESPIFQITIPTKIFHTYFCGDHNIIMAPRNVIWKIGTPFTAFFYGAQEPQVACLVLKKWTYLLIHIFWNIIYIFSISKPWPPTHAFFPKFWYQYLDEY